MTARPTTLAGPGATVRPSTSTWTFARPCLLALSDGRSPAWRSLLLGWPCGLPCGLKWPPALMPSPELQSPFSWICRPCSCPGLRPSTKMTTRTLLPTCSKSASPIVLLPLVAFSPAVARAGADESDVVWQPASIAAAAASEISVVFFMGYSSCRLNLLKSAPAWKPRRDIPGTAPPGEIMTHGSRYSRQARPARRSGQRSGRRRSHRALLRARLFGRAAAGAADAWQDRRHGRRPGWRRRAPGCPRAAALGQPDARGAGDQHGDGGLPPRVRPRRGGGGARPVRCPLRPERRAGDHAHGEPAAGGERAGAPGDRDERGLQRVRLGQPRQRDDRARAPARPAQCRRWLAGAARQEHAG